MRGPTNNPRIAIPGTNLEEIELIGHGGFGNVYRAYCPNLGRLVALKVLLSEHLSNDILNERFLREARILSQITHPNVVQVFSCGVSEDGTPYFLMEFVAGKTLARAQPNLSLEQSIEVFRNIVSGIGAIHRADLVHRDLTPANCMILDGSNDVKIIDFGLIKDLSAPLGTETLTKTNQLVGTVAYMSPEACRGEPADKRSDIYSLGCLLYFLVTGRPPFESLSLEAQLVDHVCEKVPAVENVRADKKRLPKLDEIIANCMEKDPANRYQTAEELENALNTENLLLERQAPCYRFRAAIPVALALTAVLLAFTLKNNGRTNVVPPPAPNIDFQGLSAKVEKLITATLTTDVERTVSPADRKRNTSLKTDVQSVITMLKTSKSVVTFPQALQLLKCSEKCKQIGAIEEYIDLRLLIGECVGNGPGLQKLLSQVLWVPLEYIAKHECSDDTIRRFVLVAKRIPDSALQLEILIRLCSSPTGSKPPLCDHLLEQLACIVGDCSAKEMNVFANELRTLTNQAFLRKLAKESSALLEGMIRIDSSTNNQGELGTDLWIKHCVSPKQDQDYQLLRKSVLCFEKEGFKDPRCQLPLLNLAAWHCARVQSPGNAESAREASRLLNYAKRSMANATHVDIEYLYSQILSDSYHVQGDCDRALLELDLARRKFVPLARDQQSKIIESVRFGLRAAIYKINAGKPAHAIREIRDLMVLNKEEPDFVRQLALIADLLAGGKEDLEAVRRVDALLNVLPPPRFKQIQVKTRLP